VCGGVCKTIWKGGKPHLVKEHTIQNGVERSCKKRGLWTYNDQPANSRKVLLHQIFI
jgi:hypothetical protein